MSVWISGEKVIHKYLIWCKHHVGFMERCNMLVQNVYDAVRQCGIINCRFRFITLMRNTTDFTQN